MYFLVKWIKFSVKKTKHLKNTGKMAKNTGKVREKSGNFVSPEKWEPCDKHNLAILNHQKYTTLRIPAQIPYSVWIFNFDIYISDVFLSSVF